MEKMLKIQPQNASSSPRLYPFYCNPKGEIQHQDFWNGRPKRCIGFVLPSSRFNIAVHIDQVQAELKRVQNKNMLPVFMDKDGGIYTLKEQVKVEFIDSK